MNLLDRIIASLAPETGLRRVRARAALSLARSYEGAQSNRRTDGWRVTAAGPIAEVRAGRAKLRDRSRDLVRNNAWAARAVAIRVASQIGTGIRPRAETGSAELNQQIDTLHAAWSAACAPESGGDLYAMQALAVRGMAESGEALIILDRGRTPAAGSVPLTLQVIEPDWIDDTADTLGRAGDGWRDGVRFDDAGRRVAYRLHKVAPHEVTTWTRSETRDVPAADVVHLFRQGRPGQIRGVPDVASVIMRLRDLDDYHDAALVLAKVQTLLGAFVTQPAGPAISGLGEDKTGTDGKRQEELAPGMIGYLRPGEGVEFNTPSGSGPFAEYTRVALHMIAAGFAITYHQLTGDLADANYSSLRAGSLEFRRQIEQDQHLVLVPRLCQPIWNAFIAQAILAGLLPPAAAGAPAKWTAPRFEMVDPNRDTQAAIAQVRAGFMSWADAVAEFGYDPSAQLAEIADWTKKLKASGVILDTDPSVITAAGNAVDAKQLAAIVLAAQEPSNA